MATESSPSPLKDQVDSETLGSDQERGVMENGAVADSESIDVSSPRTGEEPSPSQSSCADEEEITGSDLEDLSVEQLTPGTPIEGGQ